MTLGALLLTLVLVMGGLFVRPWPVSAEQPAILVSSNSPLPLLVDGLEAGKLPVSLQPRSQVCVLSPLHYVSEGERWTFQGWSNGPKTECVTLTEPGVYKALYKHEVVLHIRSTPSQFQKSLWVEWGSPVEVEVPEAVAEGDRVRYRFQQWSDGETPFLPKNHIAPLKPTVLEAKWVKEYLVRLEGPPGVPLLGSGWYPEGASLVLLGPETVPGQSKQERFKFAYWESVGLPVLVIPDPKKPVTTIKVDAPYSLRAVYEKQYLLVARSPLGVLKRQWVNEGEEVVLETPPVLEIIPQQEQLIFKRWEGQEGLLSPRVSGVVDQPVELKAVYERQFMVTVVAPLSAAGGGWHKEGSTVTISVPLSRQRMLVLKEQFAGFPGYSSVSPTLQMLVKEPLTVTALYRTEADLRVLGFLMAMPLGTALIYLLTRRVLLLMRRGGAGAKGGSSSSTGVAVPTRDDGAR